MSQSHLKKNKGLIHLKGTALKDYISRVGQGFLTRPWILIGLITLLGALLRLFGILHGLQENFLYHPDMTITLNEVWVKYLGLDWLKGSYNGAFYNLMLSTLIGLIETLCRFFGYAHSVWSIEQISSVACLFTATLGTVTIPVVYLIGLQSFNKTTGILAALFLSLCPLHTFQSHYPNRDVSMVFFLALALFFCVKNIKTPTLLISALGGLMAIVTVGMKPAGLVIIVPLLVSLIMTIYRTRRKWWSLLPIGLMIGLGVIFFTKGGISGRFTTTGELLNFLLGIKGGIFTGISREVNLLLQWLGYPYLLVSFLAVGYGVWRRQAEDVLLLSLFITAFLSAAFYKSHDERFLVFLLPVMAVLTARLFADLWQASLNKRVNQIAIFLVVAGLTFSAFIESAWQGVLFSLPDSRAVSGRWLEAHLPKTAKVLTDTYFPLGLNLWPNVSFIDPSYSLDQESAKGDFLVTSSLLHQRYLDSPDRYPKESHFFKSIDKERSTIKKFFLGRRGFIHSDIGIYSPYPIMPRTPEFIFPRPYDTEWNFGLSFLDQGPFDRDDRTVQLGWGQRYTATLVSPFIGQEMMVFMLNGPEESLVKVKIGYKTKVRTLKPGEFHILTFRPKWIFPKKPALYRFETGLPQGKRVLLQLRWGNREIGEALVKWGQFERSIPYIKNAIADNDSYRSDLELLLGSVYKELGKLDEARRTIDHLTRNNPQFIQMVRSLGRSGLSYDTWKNTFRKSTSLDPSFLTYALSKEFNTTEAFPGHSGMVMEDCRAKGGQIILYDNKTGKPDEVMHGPYLYLDQGVYQARFFFRTWDIKGNGPFAVINVLADNQVLSTRSVRQSDLELGEQNFKEVKISFSHSNPKSELKFQVFATGKAGFGIEKVRIEPDLQRFFQYKLLQIESLTEPLP